MSAQGRQDFIMKYADTAKRAAAINNKIFPDTIMTVAILESTGEDGGQWNPGTSPLATKANNFFGIKKGSWTGETMEVQTTETIKNPAWPPFPPETINIPVKDVFRKYATAQDSFNDFVNVLTKNYSGVLQAGTPAKQFQELQAAGYATNPKYASLLNTIYVTLKDSYSKYFSGAVAVGGSWWKPIITVAGIGLLIKAIYSQSK